MNALFFERSLSLRTVQDPEPGRNEVLIRVLYSAICNTDLEILRGYMGFTGIPGHEFVGCVVTPGHKLTGKTVVGEINCSCGNCYLCSTGRPTHCANRTVLGIFNRNGVFADFLTLPENNLHVIPEGLAPVNAVFTEPLAAAVEIFEKIRIRPSGDVFIFGAGKLGILVSLVFRLHGCKYTTFDLQPEKVMTARAMGLNVRLLKELPPQEKAEVCVDCTGSPDGIALAMEHLYPGGQLVLKTTVARPGVIDLNQLVINEITLSGSRCGPFGPAINLLAEKLIDPAPMITRIFPFREIIGAFEFAGQPGTNKVLIKHCDTEQNKGFTKITSA